MSEREILRRSRQVYDRAVHLLMTETREQAIYRADGGAKAHPTRLQSAHAWDNGLRKAFYRLRRTAPSVEILDLGD